MQSMGRLVGTSLLAGFVFGLVMSVLLVPVLYLVDQVTLGIWLSIAAGVMFGSGMGWFAYSAEKQFLSDDFAFNLDETLLHQGPANHFVGKESVGGWMRLTNQRLFFQSHDVNICVHEWEVPLQQVLGISLCLTLRMVPNGMRVVTTQGTRQFVMAKRRLWKQKIEDALGNSHS